MVNSMVWIVDEDGITTTCTLAEFFDQNPACFDVGEEDRFAAGEAIAIGGGASPRVRVQVRLEEDAHAV